MSSSALPQGFSIFQPTLGAQLQFFPAVGTQELDELIHAHLIGPASSQEKRATLALDFLDHAQRTGQTFKFYPVYTVDASPVTSVSSSFNTSPTTTSWDWSQNSRTASISSRSSQHRVSKPASPSSRVRATDFASLPGMKIMTKDGLDVTNSASRGSKTKEQRDHAHLMRIIKACDSCKRKKIRCDPSHKKRGAATPAAPAATTAKVTKKARTASPAATSQSISPPQSGSSQSVSPAIMLEDISSFSTSLFDMDPSFTFDGLDTFDPTLVAPTDLWDEFVQYPPMDQPEDYDFFADPESFLSSPSSDAALSAARISVPASSPRSGAPPGRGPDAGRAESHAGLPEGLDLATSASATVQLPYELQESVGDYTDFNLYSPRSTFSEDERMMDIGSSTSGLSTQSMPSPVDSPRRPPNPESPGLGTDLADAGDVATQPPFIRAVETEPSNLTDVQDGTAGGIAGALSVLSRSDVVMRTNEQGQLIICCPPGTVVVNSSGQRSTDTGLVNVSTVNDFSSSSLYIPRELSESAVATISASTGNVDSTISTWLDHGSGDQASALNLAIAPSPQSSPAQAVDTLEDGQSSRFVHRNTDIAQPHPVFIAATSQLDTAIDNDALTGSTGSTGNAAALLSTRATLAEADVHGGYVSDESGSLLSGHSHSLGSAASVLSDVDQDSPRMSDNNYSISSEVDNAPSTLDGSHTSDSVSVNEGSSSSSVALSAGRLVRDSDSAHDVLQTAASTISQHNVTGVGRSLQSRAAQDSVSTTELAALMQTALTRTLLVAAYAQFTTTASPSAKTIRSRACRENSLPSRRVFTPLAHVSAVC